ncbi:class D beta-lactamase [Roseivirga misakiensis]|uniref:Beta-lactamase n=1 Tax=Roseivirga misakiensis TaxID=1563681 RepID=A0A1E5T6M2_9BACT|nr:class D beta-lactamase [Roseivirga misakiensis]OEK07013.1 class D beta-lactamase [Roseivirga misakiensis]
MPKVYLTFLSLILLVSCSDKKSIPKSATWEEVPTLQKSLDEAFLDGVIVVYDLTLDKYYTSNQALASVGQLPASTFKIANSIIALETGVMASDTTLIKWDGESRAMKAWEEDLLFKQAFQRSCVPCYQEIARKIGTERMRSYLDKLDYGNIVFDSTTIDNFWLIGDSRINPIAQIDFIKRLYQSELPIADRTEGIMKRMMLMSQTDRFKLSGKTGWSIDKGFNNGWFVGFVEKANKTYFFATNISPKPEFDMNEFSEIRKSLTLEALRHLEIIE